MIDSVHVGFKVSHNLNDVTFLTNDNIFKPLQVFINLDLGVETHFCNGMDSYIKMFFQLFFPLYIITIAILIIVANKSLFLLCVTMDIFQILFYFSHFASTVIFWYSQNCIHNFVLLFHHSSTTK